MPDTTPKAYSVQFTLPADEIEEMKKLAREQNMSVPDLIRRAIVTEKFFIENTAGDRKVLVKVGDELKEVVRR